MTLEVGVHEPDQAPWWEFTCSDLTTTVVKQWMGEAARAFGQQVTNFSANGTALVECIQMTEDGSTGYYEVRMSKDATRIHYITVYRGAMVAPPEQTHGADNA